MHPILAESSYSPPEAIKAWLECLFWFMAFVTTAVGLWKLLGKKEPGKREIVNPTLEVKEAKEPVSQHELQRVEQDVKELDEKLDDKFQQLSAERSRSIASLHEKIENRTETINARIDLIPERIISILRNTGVISK